METALTAASVEVATARAALLRLLPDLSFGAPSGRSTAQRLQRMLTPPDWLAGSAQIESELAAFIRLAGPIIAAGSWQSIEDTGSGEIVRTDDAQLWSAAHDRAWALDDALGRLAVLRETQRLMAAD